MNYIEELVAGDAFIHNNIYYILTSDFKKDGQKLSYSLIDGFPKWLNGSSIVEKINLYTIDQTNNILPIKEHKKETYNV
jgi:hypothetical protein